MLGCISVMIYPDINFLDTFEDLGCIIIQTCKKKKDDTLDTVSQSSCCLVRKGWKPELIFLADCDMNVSRAHTKIKKQMLVWKKHVKSKIAQIHVDKMIYLLPFSRPNSHICLVFRSPSVFAQLWEWKTLKEKIHPPSQAPSQVEVVSLEIERNGHIYPEAGTIAFQHLYRDRSSGSTQIQFGGNFLPQKHNLYTKLCMFGGTFTN